MEKADSYTEGDWKNLKQWFQEQEPALKEFPNLLRDTKLKNDTTRAYEALKLGVDKKQYTACYIRSSHLP
ncbi:hypothetical protein GCM10020331_068690 [Ectobacillus funiculus]